MASCSGDPSNCSFCGNVQTDCAKNEVTGCAANPAACGICQGKECVAVECTGDVKTCKACSRNYQTCRKAQVTASEGVERVKPVDA